MIDKALKRIFLPFLTILLLIPGTAFAQEGLDSGDTAWMLTATVLVLMMTIPGPFSLLRGIGPGKKRSLDYYAQLYDSRIGQCAMGPDRLHPGVRARCVGHYWQS